MSALKAPAQPRAEAHLALLRVMNAIVFCAVVLASFVIYTSNKETLSSYDSASNSLLAFNLLENHRLDLDSFRGGYFTALGGQYAFEEAANGHLASAYPVGTAIVAFPIYVVFYFAQHAGDRTPPIESPAFEPLRQQYEKTAAAVIAAVSVGLFLLCARQIANSTQAAIATAVYAFATSIWSIASQALWQHGPVNVFVLAMVYALLRATRARGPARCTRWLGAAGLCAGFLTVIRPTAALFTIAGLIFALWAFRARGSAFVIALAIGAAPGLAWNAYFFHSLLGGYAGIVPMDTVYDWAPHHVATAFAGLFISPSRGVLIFSPVLAFALPGAIRAWRLRDRPALLVLLLTLACGVLVVQYAIFTDWWAGYTYGPRYFCDSVGVAGLLLLYVIPPDVRSYVRRNIATAAAAGVFTLLFLYSTVVQFVGPNSGAAGSEWNAVPVSLNTDPERVWQIADNQIERSLRAAYYRLFAWNIAASRDYERALAVHVTEISPTFSHVAAGESIAATARLVNAGSSRVYGYDSGVYVGQLRVRLRIVDAAGQTASEQYLYVGGSPNPGERATATGKISMPQQTGVYRLECDPVLVGGHPIDNSGTPVRAVMRVS